MKIWHPAHRTFDAWRDGDVPGWIFGLSPGGVSWSARATHKSCHLDVPDDVRLIAWVHGRRVVLLEPEDGLPWMDTVTGRENLRAVLAKHGLTSCFDDLAVWLEEV